MKRRFVLQVAILKPLFLSTSPFMKSKRRKMPRLLLETPASYRLIRLTSTNTDARALEVSPSNSGKYQSFIIYRRSHLDSYLAVLTLCKERLGKRSKLNVIFLRGKRKLFMIEKVEKRPVSVRV